MNNSQFYFNRKREADQTAVYAVWERQVRMSKPTALWVSDGWREVAFPWICRVWQEPLLPRVHHQILKSVKVEQHYVHTGTQLVIHLCTYMYTYCNTHKYILFAHWIPWQRLITSWSRNRLQTTQTDMTMCQKLIKTNYLIQGLVRFWPINDLFTFPQQWRLFLFYFQISLFFKQITLV